LVGSDDILFSAAPKRTYHQVEARNDLHFLVALKCGVIDYAKKFPNITKTVEKLSNLKCPGTPFKLFNDMTCEEYHFLFITLVEQYKGFVEEIATRVKNRESFRNKLGPTVKTGLTILTIVEGFAFHLYLPTIVSKLSKTLSEHSCIKTEQRAAGRHGVKERDAEEQNAEMQGADKQDVKKQDVKVGMILWEKADTAPMAL